MKKDRVPRPSFPAPGAAAFLLSFILGALPLYGQTQTSAAAQNPNQFDTADFPQWGKDLRRFEIIAFGTFPFSMFTATFAMDFWRASNHNWDGRYRPWPLKTAGAIDMTVREHEIVLMAAGITSLALAMTDLMIVQVKRYKARQKALQLPGGTPIIIKKPLEGASAPSDANPSDSNLSDRNLSDIEPVEP
jgi:hypothetical protein